ncbi:cytochrome P450 [Actinoalloteichus hoggarensis]|uniref:Cytochrome P450-SU2 n=1 Tax=Actinoalloteichus hoggarensis TaxID=1470176 RepID=A0A221W498_9PSEU|nr:cytochrome P450 [Actinoalloteichus hoggarensis]ASO20710.1 Cytochrome P450-SU2 [Actinoalloteichus hoggarensis]MBB5924436.1 cytochrome P450 [Actinoalloteichus hoggarensis]
MRQGRPEVTSLPTLRERPLDPPDELARLRDREPIARMAYPDGHLGWLVTSHAAARAVLADRRFSSRQDLMRASLPHLVAQEPRTPADPGNFIRLDPPDHTRYRQLLAGQFTMRRMRDLRPRVEHIVEGLLDEMERGPAEVDLVRCFALPVASMVICELLGAPYSELDEFQHHTAVLLTLSSTIEQIEESAISVDEFVRRLVRRKRQQPTEDLLGRLTTEHDLTDDELANIAFLLLAAGHETTANMLSLGTYTLLCHPEQLERLRAEPALIDDAVEELLRYLTIFHIGPSRTALADVELDGHLIKAGDTVTLSLSAADRDPDRFVDPDRFDVTRAAGGHLAFGHGVHQCLGQQLARMQMRVGYAALFRRFPTLRLAVDPAEVPMRADMTIYGLRGLPVSW